jgi:hypothetical protein
MAEDVALEIDVEELLRRDPMTATDCAELRRELYRKEGVRDRFLAMLDEKFPRDAKDAATLFRRGLGLHAAGRAREALDLLQK